MWEGARGICGDGEWQWWFWWWWLCWGLVAGMGWHFLGGPVGVGFWSRGKCCFNCLVPVVITYKDQCHMHWQSNYWSHRTTQSHSYNSVLLSSFDWSQKRNQWHSKEICKGRDSNSRNRQVPASLITYEDHCHTHWLFNYQSHKRTTCWCSTTDTPLFLGGNWAKRSHCHQHGETQINSQGKDDVSKKEPAVMEKPTKSGMVALAATKKPGDATTSDGSLPRTLIG